MKKYKALTNFETIADGKKIAAGELFEFEMDDATEKRLMENGMIEAAPETLKEKKVVQPSKKPAIADIDVTGEQNNGQ